MTSEVRRLAHAKVNPFLRVLGRREDGFHQIETLIHPIDLADELTFRQVAQQGFRLTIEGPEAGGIPAGPENLVVRAAAAVASRCVSNTGADITLVKRVPVAAGLGGGSADAAVTIDALAELWGCRLDRDARLFVAGSIGSDVPAMLFEEPVLATGRGELVEPVDVAPCRWRVVPAGFAISAADAYGWWDEDGAVTGPDPAPLLDAFAIGDLERAGTLLFNDLEPSILRRHSELEETKTRLLSEGAFGAIVSGSGPSVAGLYPPV
jgi:4-diphosphocytidyl-2-C-methyl-D-erythritol kinase